MKIRVLSHYLFDNDMKANDINDENVESLNKAFISIIGTKECLEYYLDEGETKHYFNDNHKNVLNLDFDDCDTHVNYNGHLFKTMTIEQAENAIDFIENMINKGVDEIKIHCRAGYSRSRAFAEFIYRYCKENDIDVDYDERRYYTTVLNQGVLRRLNHAYWKKHKMNDYEDGNIDYPKDMYDIYVIADNCNDYCFCNFHQQ